MTSYFVDRTAFQRSDSNDVRVSLDVDLRFSDAANADVDPFIPTKVHGFPMAILEVKLARGKLAQAIVGAETGLAADADMIGQHCGEVLILGMVLHSSVASSLRIQIERPEISVARSS